MLSAKNIVTSDGKIPSTWVFENYLDLPEKLIGQDIKMISVFNPTERTPSMCIFLDKKSAEYKYKDFSSGNYGSKIDLIKELFDLDYSKAVFKLLQDYNSYVLKHGTYQRSEFKEYAKYKIDFAKGREWNANDRDYWLQFGIGTTILFEYNVKALEYYKMTKEEDGKVNSIKIRGPKVYGYFNKERKMYKVYQPDQKKHKFIKIFHYLQGIDQLKYNQPNLIICSSLKDAMTLRHFNYNVEVIAPDSENTVIKPYVIENLKQKYKRVITLFDNDKAGIKAIEKYHELYNIPGTYITISKDLSDAVRDHGFKKSHEELKRALRECLNKKE